jgi:hypothetical protein
MTDLGQTAIFLEPPVHACCTPNCRHLRQLACPIDENARRRPAFKIHALAGPMRSSIFASGSAVSCSCAARQSNQAAGPALQAPVSGGYGQQCSTA